MSADHTPEEIRDRFWETLRADPVVMLGLPGTAQGRPMTARMGAEDGGPLWFFTDAGTDLGAIDGPVKAEMAFVAKGHEVFATAHGTVSQETDRSVLDALWNRYVEAWFEGGKDDPNLRLIRFDGGTAEVWLGHPDFKSASTVLVSSDHPREAYADSHVRVAMG